MRKCGFVGFPNVGKSTLFNFISQTDLAKSENYPFCTIEPNETLVFYKDPRVNELSKFSNSEKLVFSPVKIVDIAGLVEGASRGEGLGNQFLAHIREVDAIVHVVRCFDSGDITHVMDSIDPVRDIEIIFTELRIADLETIEKMKKKYNKDQEMMQKLIDAENEINNENFIESNLPLLCAKRFFVLGNGHNTTKIKNYCNERNIKFLNFDFSEGNADNIRIFLEEVFNLLNIIFYFTTGKKETRAWPIQKGTNAKDAASEIHTDISNKFIKAMVYHCSEIKNKPKIRTEGAAYIVKDGDVMEFKHNG